MAKVRLRNIEEQKKRKVARHRFRYAIRCVVANCNWMSEMDDDKLTLNVKKNIITVVRPHNKIGILTKAERTLLHMPHHKRTVQDRKDLVKLISGLLCFSRIPPKFRARLVPVIKFMMLGPGRKLINSGDSAHMIYYIVSGEIEISSRVLDKLTNKYIEKLEYFSGAGDCLGDIEILEGCRRLNSYKSTEDTELLFLTEDDYNLVLRPYMFERWLNLKRMINSLQYFNYMTDKQLFTCYKLSKRVVFEPLETIYYQDQGKVGFVHFVISGECMILQCLKIMVKTRNRNKTFELVEFTKDDNDVFQNLVQEEVLKKLHHVTPNDKVYDEVLSDEGTKKVIKRADLKTVEIQCGLREPSVEEIIPPTENSSDVEENMEEEILSAENVSIKRGSIFSQHRRASTASQRSAKSNVTTTKIENHFIDVGSYTYGGIFGLGEKMSQRVIMARTTVQCLLVPRFWLLSELQNPCNIWQKKRYHIDSNIPSRETLFKDYLATRKWQKFKHDLVQSSVNDLCGNPTKIEDVPIIGRIVETND